VAMSIFDWMDRLSARMASTADSIAAISAS
jgi:hypothetical protein